MAYYVVWGCAITEALGINKKHFLEAYEENINAQNLEVVRSSPISDVLIKLMKANPLAGWEGTPSQLYSELEEKAKELKISTRQKAWPKKPHVLSRRLNELAPSLPSIGYQIEMSRSGKSRLIRISSVTSVTSVTRQEDWGKGKDLRAYLNPKSDASDANDGTSESLAVIESVPKPTGFEYGLLQEKKRFLETVKFVKALDPPTEGKCWLCDKKRVLYWQLQNPQEEWADVCQDCGMKVQKAIRKEGDVE